MKNPAATGHLNGASFTRQMTLLPFVVIEYTTMNALRKLNQGKVLLALSVAGRNKAQGVSSLNQLEDYGLLRPSKVEHAKKSESEYQAAQLLRKDLNRSFDKARLDRAEDYSCYIEQVECNGHIGGTPAITLYHETPLEETDGGILVPYSASLTAIDGETQTEARYMLRERSPGTGNNEVAITVYHGMSYDQAKQILHDYNAYGKRVNEKVLANFNSAGPITQAVKAAIQACGLSLSRINERGAKANKKTVAAMQQLLAAAAGYQRNGMALEGAITPEVLGRLNVASAVAVPPAGVNAVSEFLKSASTNSAIGGAPAIVWQVAGARCSAGAAPSALNWTAAIAAFNATKLPGRGGVRTPVRERIAAIAAAI